jgi:medium-chain acyl-[acyl-carrier-protein] hydrolase
VIQPDPWIADWPRPERARTILVCLPHAGSGANQFRSWQSLIGPEVAVVGVRLPGRENRFNQEPETRLADVIDALTPVLAARLDRPYLIFGHSMGALLGYELARALGTRHERWPEHVVASASRAPHRQDGDETLGLLSDAELITHLIDHGVVPAFVRDQPALTRLVVRPLRGDIAICANYRPDPRPPLPCPIDAWRGEADEGVTKAQIREWNGYSAVGTTVRTFAGGHLYHLDQAPAVVSELHRLSSRRARSGCREPPR